LLVQVHGNAILLLPNTLCMCNKLRYLDVSHNKLQALQSRIYLWAMLRHLDLSYNRMQTLPSALGWLALDFLAVTGNPALRIPKAVQEHPAGQVHAVLTFLQIVCEQHRLIEHHLNHFVSPPGQPKTANYITSGARALLPVQPSQTMHSLLQFAIDHTG
jgi:leucine-rich repeat protein SHOC2